VLSGSTQERYRSLDISKNEIRLLSFENSAKHAQVQLNLHYVSLDDWKPEYVAFRDQNTSKNSSQLSEAWSEQVDVTLDKPVQPKVYDAVTRFIWGDYICLSYTWGDCEDKKATIVLDGVAIAVSKHLEAALQDLRSSFECQLGMKVWADALCINQVDLIDRNTHVLRVKDIFGGAFCVVAWTKESDDLHVVGLEPPGGRLHLCELIMEQYGREVLEELLGVRNRDWGAAEEEDEQLMGLVEDAGVLVFDQYHWADSADEDEFGFVEQHLRDIVRVELWMMLRKEYWSRLWVIQELAVSPTTSTVRWGDSTFQLSTLQAVGNILLTHSASGQPLNSEIWKELKIKLDLLAFITTWRTLGVTEALNDATIRELKVLTEHANCSLPQDKVYGLLGLFPSSVSGAVTIDYSRETAVILAEFCAVVPGWNCS
jgi:hypothetical protein